MHPQVEAIYPSPRFWHTDLVLVTLMKQKKYMAILVYQMAITDSASSL